MFTLKHQVAEAVDTQGKPDRHNAKGRTALSEFSRHSVHRHLLPCWCIRIHCLCRTHTSTKSGLGSRPGKHAPSWPSTASVTSTTACSIDLKHAQWHVQDIRAAKSHFVCFLPCRWQSLILMLCPKKGFQATSLPSTRSHSPAWSHVSMR